MSQYLEDVLAAQTLKKNGPELLAIDDELDRIREIIEAAFPDSKPTVKFGGSRAKGTMVLLSYDVDIIIYFPRDDDGAGETLKDIYHNVRSALADDYFIEEKTSALRLFHKADGSKGQDLRIDVVPGRYVDDTRTDVYLYQNRGEKQRLKTNLDTHLKHIQGSGVRPAIRLLKIWRSIRGLNLKTFVLELLAVDLLAKHVELSLDDQLTVFWETVKEKSGKLSVEDPANPNNDLSPLFDLGVQLSLSNAAGTTLGQVKNQGWEAIFGSVPSGSDSKKSNEVTALRSLGAQVQVKTKPWSRGI